MVVAIFHSVFSIVTPAGEHGIPGKPSARRPDRADDPATA